MLITLVTRVTPLVVAIALTACPKAPAPESPPSPVATPVEPPPIAPRTGGAVGDVLDGYDALRLALAHDDADAAKKAASKVSSSAHDGAADTGIGADAKKLLTDLGDAADKLVKAGDIEAARTAFGDVSKLVVTLVAADPKLQTGRFLFKCPMAKGYQKWVQTTTTLENPFFGKSMLDCGEQLSAWSV